MGMKMLPEGEQKRLDQVRALSEWRVCMLNPLKQQSCPRSWWDRVSHLAPLAQAAERRQAGERMGG